MAKSNNSKFKRLSISYPTFLGSWLKVYIQHLENIVEMDTDGSDVHILRWRIRDKTKFLKPKDSFIRGSLQSCD
jgi:hypothetical protein